MRHLFTILFVTGYFLCAFSQPPQGFNYQAVIRDVNGDILANSNVTIRFTIQISSAELSVIKYQETHALVTNEFGLLNCVVGDGTVLQGSISTVDWNEGERYLKVEVDPGTGFVNIGIQQVMSVPYALSALDAPNSWGTSGNEGTNPTDNFIGTTDNSPLIFRVNNENAGRIDHVEDNLSLGHLAANSITFGNNITAIGNESLTSNTTGYNNTAIGHHAMHANTTGYLNTAVGGSALSDNTNGVYNSALGHSAMRFNTTGDFNAAFGSHALNDNTTGDYNNGFGNSALHDNTTGTKNVAFGGSALYHNMTGSNNIAIGHSTLFWGEIASNNIAVGNEALQNNTTGGMNIAIGVGSLNANISGDFNVAIGENALNGNTTGTSNVALGMEALTSNSAGFYNTALGYKSLNSNSSGDYNTSTGMIALFNNTTGGDNTADGYEALRQNVVGNRNTAMGSGALYYNESDNNVAVGYDAGGNQSTGSGCTFLGYSAEGSAGTYSNATAIGNQAVVSASNRVRVGNTDVTQIGGQVAWSNLSDARQKKNIQLSPLGLDFIQKLKPVTYNFIEGHEGILYTGLIAQDVERSLNELDVEFSGITKPENETDLYSLRYSEFVMPLIKAVQEQQNMIDELKNENQEMKRMLEMQQAQLKVLMTNSISK